MVRSLRSYRGGQRLCYRRHVGDVDPAALGRRLQHGVDDGLAAHAVIEGGRAWFALDDGLHESEVFVVAERRGGVARVRIARRAGIDQELARYIYRLQRFVGPADLYL